jgi:hypothetical protein
MNMNKPLDPRTAIRESMDKIDEFWTPRKNPQEFGQKTEPSGSEEHATQQRRLGDAVGRANDEKKSYGFLRSLKNKMFGNKAPEPEFKRQERSPEERRAAVIDRARKS